MVADLGIPALIAAVVGTLCLLLAAASWRAMLQTGNRAIYFVVAAFAILGIKAYAKSYNLAMVGQESATLELVFSLMDLSAVALFAWPLLQRGGVGGTVR